jgi:phosphopentomutase
MEKSELALPLTSNLKKEIDDKLNHIYDKAYAEEVLGTSTIKEVFKEFINIFKNGISNDIDNLFLIIEKQKKIPRKSFYKKIKENLEGLIDENYQCTRASVIIFSGNQNRPVYDNALNEHFSKEKVFDTLLMHFRSYWDKVYLTTKRKIKYENRARIATIISISSLIISIWALISSNEWIKNIFH